jgi:hypothetical protein
MTGPAPLSGRAGAVTQARLRGGGHGRAGQDRIGVMMLAGDLVKQEMHLQRQAAQGARVIVGNVPGHSYDSSPARSLIRLGQVLAGDPRGHHQAEAGQVQAAGAPLHMTRRSCPWLAACRVQSDAVAESARQSAHVDDLPLAAGDSGERQRRLSTAFDGA